MHVRSLMLQILLAAVVATSSLAQTPSRVGSEYIPGDATATIVLSVAETLASPAVELYPIEVADAWCKQNIGFPANIVDRLKVIVGTPGPGEPMVAIVATLQADLDLKTLNPESINLEQPIDVDGHQCFQVAAAPDVAFHAKDARTLILSTPNYLDAVLRSAEPSSTRGPLAKMAADVPHPGNLTGLVAIEPVRPMLNGFTQMYADRIPPPLAEFTKVPDLLDAVLLRVNLKDKTNGASLVMLARDDASSQELLDLIARGLDMGRQMGLSEAMSQLQGDDAVSDASRRYAQRMADHYVTLLTPQRDGRRLTISGAPSHSLATQGVLVSLLLPAIQSARKAARLASSRNNIKQIGLAMHNYHAAYKHLPTDIKSDDGTPLLSWRVALLPFLEQAALYDQFRLDEPWNSPHNSQLMARMPDFYRHPALHPAPPVTIYQRPVGDGFVMDPSQTIAFRAIADGLSNTIMVIETKPEIAVPWTKPSDVTIDPDDPLSAVAESARGFSVLMCDGVVTDLGTDIDAALFLAYLTRAGNEVIRRR